MKEKDSQRLHYVIIFGGYFKVYEKIVLLHVQALSHIIPILCHTLAHTVSHISLLTLIVSKSS